ncbi:hypothetical protein CR956_01840 [Candidatus Saccharibacteria bacterium]|nr:MAG: hypothetical protein CR956_01840 [Candidatus Saccharibacteria bacterium]
MSKISIKNLLPLGVILSGLVAVGLYFLSQGHYPPTSNDQLLASVANWFGAVFVVLALAQLVMLVLERKK